ncbi:putative protein OS=Streptomyces albaduncus OX=68172 GN=FHS32_006351 PE=4 SV=1 [Streptomyces griseoloalbus]
MSVRLVPRKGPTEPGLRRLIDALEREPGSSCPVCRAERLVGAMDLDHEPSAGPACTDCGILVPSPVLTPAALAESRRARLLVSA